MRKNVLQIGILVAVAVVLALIPRIFWGNLSFVGGDDSKLYYLFPLEYFKHFTLTMISENSLGSMGNYFSQSYISLFALFIFVIHTVFFFLNTQLLMFGLNLAAAFLFFFFLLGLFLQEKNWLTFAAKILGSLIYCLSTFHSFSLFSSQLFSMYLISIYPGVMYLFFRGLLRKNSIFVVGAAILLSCFSILIYGAIPWMAALLIVSIPLFLYFFWRQKLRTFLSLLLFLIVVAVLNFYWLFHFFYAPINSGQQRNDTNTISTTIQMESRTSNEYLIKHVAGNNEVVYPLFNLFHRNIQLDYNWSSYQIYSDWHLRFFTLNSLFPLIVIAAGITMKKKQQQQNIQEEQRSFRFALAGWILSIYFFTARIGSWGLNLFLWYNTHIPGFLMFRNMYDKFGPAMAFSYALVFGISCVFILRNLHRPFYRISFFCVCLFIILFNAKPFIFDEYHSDPLWTSKKTYSKIENFNTDFYTLIEYLKQFDSAERFMWLPFNTANYVEIRDNLYQNYYYVGVSPLQFLAQKPDFTGKLSFAPAMGERLEADALAKKYVDIGRLFQQAGIRYLIVNHDVSPDLQSSYLFTFASRGDLYLAQDASFMNVILGEKIKDFGQRYSLYRINPAFENRKIYLTDEYQNIPADFSQLQYQKVSSAEYRVTISHLQKPMKIVFLDPYQRLWRIESPTTRTPIISGEHDLPFQYANGWIIDPKQIRESADKDSFTLHDDGSIDAHFFIFFVPQRYFKYSVCVSMVAAGIILLAVVFMLMKRIFWKRRVKRT